MFPLNLLQVFHTFIYRSNAHTCTFRDIEFIIGLKLDVCDVCVGYAILTNIQIHIIFLLYRTNMNVCMCTNVCTYLHVGIVCVYKITSTDTRVGSCRYISEENTYRKGFGIFFSRYYIYIRVYYNIYNKLVTYVGFYMCTYMLKVLHIHTCMKIELRFLLKYMYLPSRLK